MSFPSKAVFGLFWMGLVLTPGSAWAQVERYEFYLDTSTGFCNAASAETSCVRYNGDSAFFPAGTMFEFDADFGSQTGNLVPITFRPGFFFPDIQLALNQMLVIEAPSEQSGSAPTGTWDLSTGTFDIDIGPTDFPNALDGQVLSIDPFDAVSDVIPGTLQCITPIPPINGSRLNGNDEMTIVARGCVPVVNETFFAILKGTVVPEPGESLLAAAALLALSALAHRSSNRRRALL